MINLKTLNETKCEPFSKVELKQEAIKWIKHISKDGFQHNINVETMEDFAREATTVLLKGETDIVVRWIKHFFNITEGDLK